jgi:3-oxoacyl-[acyl-carrier-protein] synthase-3
MNHHSTANGSILGVVAAVPARVVRNADCPDPAAADEAAKLTGVQERRWVRSETAADLCTAAANRLLPGMGWAGADLDLIVYVTQTPTRAVPADVYSIAAGLGATCPCMQINWSCSGYVYGLWTAMRMLAAGQRALLLVGDVTSTIADPADRATCPLFGDAGSATAILGGGPEQHFVMGTDGAGADKLHTERHFEHMHAEAGRDYLRMDGAAVFNFTLKVVPALAAALREFGEPDVWLLHQANAFMLKHLEKKAALGGIVPTNIERFGNTSCASIPLLMCTTIDLLSDPQRLAMLGFGAGWAWAGANIDAPAMRMAEWIEA